MNPLLFLLTGLAASAAVALLVARRLVRAQSPRLAPPEVEEGADPLLSLVLRANQALGVWVVPAADGGRAVLARLPAGMAELAGARLDGLASGRTSGSGTERLEAATLVWSGDEGRVAGALLPPDSGPGDIEALRRDLARLLDDIRRRPVLAAVERDRGRPAESVESIAMRLGHEVERLLDTDVAVALVRPVGVQVLGVSLRSDPRLLLALASPGSALDRVGRGIEAGPVRSDDPLGRAGAERRRAKPGAVVLAIPGPDLPVGAVVVSVPDGRLPAGPLPGQLLAILDRAGPRLAAALERRDLEETATSDPLTGLRNRRGLDAAMSLRERQEGTLVYADLDHFKRLNDTLGHAAGDAALVHFSRVAGQRIRTGDVAARIGGEEFALWLPGATLLEGTAAAERIRRALEEGEWGWQGRPWGLTASFGVAACPETVPAIEHLSARADEALYEAKRTGRNRVVSAM